MAELDLNPDRMPTGVDGLDAVLQGGLLRGRIYLVEGAPGTGKTILANQICYGHAERNGQTVFATRVSDPQLMLRDLRSFPFFDPAAIDARVHYTDAPMVLDRDGYSAMVDLFRRAKREHAASLLVIEGLDGAAAPFIRDIRREAADGGCTVLLLTAAPDEGSEARALADGVIHMDDTQFGNRGERGLRVVKFRGSDSLPGRHSFRITKNGIAVYPRTETIFAVPPIRDRYRPLRMSTGIEGLDLILRGGLPSETSNALYGPTGSGKTTFGLHYIGLSSAVEPGLYFGMYESPERLRVKSAALGIDLAGLEERGHVEIVWRPQGEVIIDELAHLIVDGVRRRGVKRLFIDGFGGLLESALEPDRISLFVSTLSNTLRSLNVTTVLTMEARDIIGSEMILPAYGLSSLLEGLIVLRYVELRGKVQRLLTVTKIRDSDFDPTLREVRMTDRGIVVDGAFMGAEALLSGFGREVTERTG